MNEIITKNSEETQKLGEEFVRQLSRGDIVVLYGDLGAGKTTFVQGLAKGLGIEKRIISPTFVIIRSYEIPFLVIPSDQRESRRHHEVASPLKGNLPQQSLQKIQSKKFLQSTVNEIPPLLSVGRDDKNHFYHVDLYRLRGEEDIEGTGLLEILRSNAIVAIEWPEKMGSLLPEKRWEVRFEHLDGDERKIILMKISKK